MINIWAPNLDMIETDELTSPTQQDADVICIDEPNSNSNKTNDNELSVNNPYDDDNFYTNTSNLAAHESFVYKLGFDLAMDYCINNSIDSVQEENKNENLKKRVKPFKLKLKRCSFCNFKTDSLIVLDTHMCEPHILDSNTSRMTYRCNYCLINKKYQVNLMVDKNRKNNYNNNNKTSNDEYIEYSEDNHNDSNNRNNKNNRVFKTRKKHEYITHLRDEHGGRTCNIDKLFNSSYLSCSKCDFECGPNDINRLNKHITNTCPFRESNLSRRLILSENPTDPVIDYNFILKNIQAPVELDALYYEYLFNKKPTDSYVDKYNLLSSIFCYNYSFQAESYYFGLIKIIKTLIYENSIQVQSVDLVENTKNNYTKEKSNFSSGKLTPIVQQSQKQVVGKTPNEQPNKPSSQLISSLIAAASNSISEMNTINRPDLNRTIPITVGRLLSVSSNSSSAASSPTINSGPSSPNKNIRAPLIINQTARNYISTILNSNNTVNQPASTSPNPDQVPILTGATPININSGLIIPISSNVKINPLSENNENTIKKVTCHLCSMKFIGSTLKLSDISKHLQLFHKILNQAELDAFLKKHILPQINDPIQDQISKRIKLIHNSTSLQQITKISSLQNNNGNTNILTVINNFEPNLSSSEFLKEKARIVDILNKYSSRKIIDLEMNKMYEMKLLSGKCFICNQQYFTNLLKHLSEFHNLNVFNSVNTNKCLCCGIELDQYDNFIIHQFQKHKLISFVSLNKMYSVNYLKDFINVESLAVEEPARSALLLPVQPLRLPIAPLTKDENIKSDSEVVVDVNDNQNNIETVHSDSTNDDVICESEVICCENQTQKSIASPNKNSNPQINNINLKVLANNNSNKNKQYNCIKCNKKFQEFGTLLQHVHKEHLNSTNLKSLKNNSTKPAQIEIIDCSIQSNQVKSGNQSTPDTNKNDESRKENSINEAIDSIIEKISLEPNTKIVVNNSSENTVVYDDDSNDVIILNSPIKKSPKKKNSISKQTPDKIKIISKLKCYFCPLVLETKTQYQNHLCEKHMKLCKVTIKRLDTNLYNQKIESYHRSAESNNKNLPSSSQRTRARARR